MGAGPGTSDAPGAEAARAAAAAPAAAAASEGFSAPPDAAGTGAAPEPELTGTQKRVINWHCWSTAMTITAGIGRCAH